MSAFLVAVAVVIIGARLVAEVDIYDSAHRDARHRHTWVAEASPIGGTGWTIYRCDCGATELG